MLALIREKHPTIPIGLLMYANLVFNNGIDAFYARCEQVGVDSVLVADVPVEESAPSARRRYGIISRRSSSARQMRMTIFCARSHLTAAVTPTCFRVRASPARKTVAHCRCIISLRSLKSTMPRLRYRASVSPRRNRCLRPCVPGRLALSPAQPLSRLSRKTSRLPNRCWRSSGPLSQR